VVEALAPPRPLAVQLYTFRDPARFGGAGLGLDEATLGAVAEAGFLGVETVDVPGGDPVAARGLLAGLDLAVASSHTWADMADTEAFARASADIAELGSRRIIVSGRVDATPDAVASTIDRLGGAAEIATRHGLRLGYHNHSGEMAILDGTRIIDRMAAGLGDAIDFQVDIFWVVVGGADPANLISGLGERVVSLHVKDGVELPASAYGDAPFVNVVVGTGVVDPIPSIVAAEASSSVEWLIVEFDHVDGEPLDATRASLDSLVDHGLARGRRE
jgi:sugar phosphate isomerase/epimerase